MKSTNQPVWTKSERKSGMGKDLQPTQSIPPMGLNDNLVFMGKELHVQTENRSSSPPCILTQVFLNGRVVSTTKSEFLSDYHEAHDYGKIKTLMHTQHFRVIQNIKDKQAKILGQS